MPQDHPNDPLHGVTLKAILEHLIALHDWSGLAERIPIDCFRNEPSLSSSLKFLRKTPWARAKVERLYVDDQAHRARRRKKNARRKAMREQRSEPETSETSEAPSGPPEGIPEGG